MCLKTTETKEELKIATQSQLFLSKTTQPAMFMKSEKEPFHAEVQNGYHCSQK
jgi:hypothetical protein